MTNELKISINDEALSTLLRSNLSSHLGQIISQELLNKMTIEIVESINYFLNKQNDEKNIIDQQEVLAYDSKQD